MRAGALLTVVAALVAACAPHAGAFSRATTVPREGVESCALDSAAAVVLRVDEATASEWHGRFDLIDTARLWEPAEPDTIIANFRDAVRARLDVPPEPGPLMERQRAIFAAIPGPMGGEAAISTRVLEGQLGTIAPISCLEAMLWKWQAARYPMLTHPTEFGAYILRRAGAVRVYLSSDDRVGQRVRGTITALVRGDVRAGYRLAAHLHNHPFLFGRVVGDRMWTTPETLRDVAGALAPSMSDVAFYRSLGEEEGLAESWVTNGLHTAHYPTRTLPAPNR